MNIRKLFKTIYSKINHKGFTIIELLVVVFIISLMAGMVIVYVNTARQKAHDSQRKADLDMVQVAIESYAGKKGGGYPATFTSGSSPVFLNSLAVNWVPGLAPDYISVLPKDPINDSNFYYTYVSDGTNYKLDANIESDQGWNQEDGGIDENKYEVFNSEIALTWTGPAPVVSPSISPTPSSSSSCPARGTSLNFKIDDYVLVPYSASLNPDYITLSVWICPEIRQGPGYYWPVVSKGRQPGKKYPYNIVIFQPSTEPNWPADEWKVWGIVYTKNGGGLVYSNNNISTYQWTHLTFTYDGVTAKLYINGVLDNSAPTDGGSIITNREPFYFARIGDQPGDGYFIGKMDDVRIFNRALLESEIQNIVNGGDVFPAVGYYKLNEGSGIIAGDSSGNNNNGQIFGAQW